MLSLCLLLFTQVLWATPDELEVWFVTPPGNTLRMDLLRPVLPRTQLLASTSCEQVGDFCLDSKTGALMPRLSPPVQQEEAIEIPYQPLLQLPSASSLDRQLVNCEQGNAFDIFCGKAQAEAVQTKRSELEIWMDISSSMRSVDGTEECHRKKFLQGLMGLCEKSKPKIMGFDVEIREIGISESCINRGLNDAKKMMKWIEESKAKKLIVITDVYEYQSEFAAFLSQKNAKIKGDTGFFPAVQLLDHLTTLAKWCE